MEPSNTLAYAPGLEHHHLTMNMLGGHGCRLERERYGGMLEKIEKGNAVGGGDIRPEIPKR